MKRTHILAALGAATLALLTACGGAGSGAASGEGGVTTLKIAAVQGGVMPVDFRAGIKEGIFARHGLDLQVETLATGLDDISAAVQGSADIGYSDIFGGTSARGNGFDVGLVSPHNGNGGYHYLLVPKDSPIQTPADLVGKNVAIGAPPLFKTLVSVVLTNAGVDPAAVNYTLVKDQTTFGALLQTGQVDAASVSSAINSEKWIAEQGLRPILDPAAATQGISLDHPVAGWWATKDWYAENTETAQKFTEALGEIQTWFGGLTATEQATYYLEQTKADPVELDKAFPGLLDKLTVGAYNPYSGAVDEAKLTAWLAEGTKYAAVPQIPPADLLLPTARATT